MKVNRIFRAITSLVLVLVMVGGVVFSHATADAAAPKSVKITTSTKEVGVGKSITLKATFAPKKATAKVTWSTNKKAVATVNNKGVVTGKKAGKATITAKTNNGKSAKVTITVSSGSSYAKGTVLWDQTKEKDPAKRVAVAKYDQFKYHVSAIYLFKFHLQATGEAADDDLHGPARDLRGLRLKLTGEYKMDGPDAEELLLQLNYTRPQAYPIVWQTDKKKGPVKGGKWNKVEVEFNLPKNAYNNDQDSNYSPPVKWPIQLYFANKPNNVMSYRPGNDFTFRKFKLSVVGPATDDNEIKEKPAKPK